MRLVRWLPLIVIVQACASQPDATDRQLRQHEERIKQLTAHADSQEERILALEAALRAVPDSVHPAEQAKDARPDLPVVKVAPNGQQMESSPDAPTASEDVGDDTRRLTIVGEGSRVEARAANEPPPARRSSPANSRTSKGNQANSSSSSTGSVSQ